ncbi:hypothetical protein KC644_00455 [Candidatus Berkelbacteria bacterium]|nr:hypothetical protein [Candidatus Berkelbacteria bacterium]
MSKDNCKNYGGVCGGGIYGVGMIGALVYFFNQADSFGGYIFAILKALIWPGFLVYQLFNFLN